ncbi:MAG: type II toxin-antitoxin system RelE/ParE family toxin [Rudaea sp.]
MIFIETPIFTKLITALGDDDSYRQLQQLLTRDPRAGDLIQGTGGLRKIRMAASGRGKRGGARVIYYYFVSESRIARLFVFPKNVRTDLSTEQKRILCKIVETWRQPP